MQKRQREVRGENECNERSACWRSSPDCASTTEALAQKYPVRPVKIMVGFSAGGPVDVVARIVGDRLSNKLGQPFVVENRAGANGMIAAEGVARADADGYTILACNSSTITLNKTLFKDIRYDPQ